MLKKPVQPRDIIDREIRGLRMGGWIRHGWILRFWGALIVNPEVPNYLFLMVLGPLDE